MSSNEISDNYEEICSSCKKGRIYILFDKDMKIRKCDHCGYFMAMKL